MNFTFEDDAMSDEPEPKDPPAPPAQSPAQTIYRQAHFYRRAKTVLNDADADPGEKAMALVTLRRLWEDGYSIAAHQLGKAYRDGLGSQVDREAAVEWFRKSAEAGNDCSAYALGKLLLEQGKFSQARSWLQKAATQNNQYAQYRLGKLLLIGANDVPKDTDAAIRHLKDSAAQGNQFAQYTLGKLYLLGHEVKTDHEEALLYLSQAAAQGNTYLNGASLKAIAEELTGRQIPYTQKTTTWDKARIARIIDNAKFVGTEEYDPIIDEAIYEAAVSLKTARQRNTCEKENDAIDLLRDFVRCDNCGQPMKRRISMKHRIRESWNCTNDECGIRVRISDAQLIETITVLINRIIVSRKWAAMV